MPDRKIEVLRGKLQTAMEPPMLRARFIASRLVDRIIAISLELGPVARFMTRALYALLLTRQAWCDMLPLTSESREELKFWTESIEEYNAHPIWHSPSAVKCVYSDASDVGYGGYSVEHGMRVAQGIWSPEEAKAELYLERASSSGEGARISCWQTE